MKKKLAIAGAIALAGVLGVTAAGCSNSNRNLASLSSNWYYDTSFKRIQPTFTEETAERLTYAVVQAGEQLNKTYSVEYADGTYTTEFYAKKITAAELENITLEDWREDYERALGKDGYMYLYYYATELSLPAITFTCKGESETFTNQSVKTESYFFSVEDYLRPVYSVRTVNTAIPRELQAGSLAGCYYKVDMVYESFYTLSGNNVHTNITTYTTDEQTHERKESTEVFPLDGLNSYDNSVFDVAYLDIVVRGMRNISTAFSQTIGIYTPGLQVGDYTVANSDTPLLTDQTQSDTQLAIISSILQSKGLFTPDPEKGQQLQTIAVSVAFNGGSYSGVSQTYWFAVGDTNETRTLMVKYSEPLHYNLGRLDYVLTDIDSVY